MVGALSRMYVHLYNFQTVITGKASIINKTVFQDCKLKMAFLFIFIQHLIIFRALGYASNSVKFEITKINNNSKCLGGGDDLKVCMLRGRGSRNQ